MDEMISESVRVYVEKSDGTVMGSYRRVAQWSLGHGQPRLACFNALGRLVCVVNTVPEARDAVIEFYARASTAFTERNEPDPAGPAVAMVA